LICVQSMRQAEQGLAAAVDEAGSLLNTAPVNRAFLQTQLQDCLACFSDSQVALLFLLPWVTYFQQNLQAIVWLTYCEHLLHSHDLLVFYHATEC